VRRPSKPTADVSLNVHSNSSAGGLGRADKWLWSVRVFKTRAEATAACRAGAVDIEGRESKPAREIRAGDVVTVRQGIITRTLQVLAAPRARVGAKMVAQYCLETTPPREFEKLREQRVQHILARPKGLGRPTKRDRRALDRLFE